MRGLQGSLFCRFWGWSLSGLKIPAFRILNKRLVISLKRRKIGVYEKIAKSLFV